MSYKLTGGQGFRSRQRGGGSKGGSNKFREGDWTCAQCEAHNFSKRTDCYRCHAPIGSKKKRKPRGEASRADDDDASSSDEAVEDSTATANSFDMLMHSLVKNTARNVLAEFATDQPSEKNNNNGRNTGALEESSLNEGTTATNERESNDSESGAGVDARQEAAESTQAHKQQAATDSSDAMMSRFFELGSDATALLAAAGQGSSQTRKFVDKGVLRSSGAKTSKSSSLESTGHILQLNIRCTGFTSQLVEPGRLCAANPPATDHGFLDTVKKFDLSTRTVEIDVAAANREKVASKSAKRAKLSKKAKRKASGATVCEGKNGNDSAGVSFARKDVHLSDRLAPYPQWPAALRTRLGNELFQLLGSYADVHLNGLSAAALAARAYGGPNHRKACLAVDSTTHCAIALHLLNHVLKAYSVVQRHTNRLSKIASRQRAKRKASRMQAAMARAAAKQQGDDHSGVSAQKDKGTSDGHEESESESDNVSDGDNSSDSDNSSHEEDGDKPKPRVPDPGAASDEDDDSHERDFRDQGFTRAKILVVAPMRCDALRFVRAMQKVLPAGQIPNNIERFMDEFDSPESEDEPDEDQDSDTGHDSSAETESRNKSEKKKNKNKKPKPEWQEVFAGNADDDFLLGIAVRRRGLKLYAGLYNCDIIIASPLGLRRKVGAPVDKHRDYDFLSSIEIAYIDRSDVILMQNWQHMGEIFDVANLRPQTSHGADFSRIRPATLDDQAKVQRQTIISGAFDDAVFNQFLRQQCSNFLGSVKVGASLDSRAKEGVLSRVALSMRQLFHRVPVPSGDPADVGDVRFKFFRKQLLPLLLGRGAQRRTLIFVASYFDFVRVRNLLHETIPSDFVMCSEYSRQQDVSRNRSNFFHGRAAAMLTTERFYFYKRYRFRGAQHVIFYGVPKHADFYCDMLNALDTDGQQVQCTASVLFTQFELLELQRVVGTKRAAKMVRGVKDTFMFC